jgi:hypothetical protein
LRGNTSSSPSSSSSSSYHQFIITIILIIRRRDLLGGPGGRGLPIPFIYLFSLSTLLPETKSRRVYGGGSGSSSERTEDHGFAGDVGLLALSVLDGEQEVGCAY